MPSNIIELLKFVSEAIPYALPPMAVFAALLFYYGLSVCPRRAIQNLNSGFDRPLKDSLQVGRGLASMAVWFDNETAKIVIADVKRRYFLDATNLRDWSAQVTSFGSGGESETTFMMVLRHVDEKLPFFKFRGLNASECESLDRAFGIFTDRAIQIHREEKTPSATFSSLEKKEKQAESLNDLPKKQAKKKDQITILPSTKERIKTATKLLKTAKFTKSAKEEPGGTRKNRVRQGVAILMKQIMLEYKEYDGHRDFSVIYGALENFFVKPDSAPETEGYTPKSLKTTIHEKINDMVEAGECKRKGDM